MGDETQDVNVPGVTVQVFTAAIVGSPTRALIARYSILTWKVREGSPYATAYHSPSGPIMKYTSCP